jgi:CRP-like cAMP-binding protein
MSYIGILKQADIFYGFTPQQLELVSSICVERGYDLGEIIFQENSRSDELYIIARGEVEILVDPSLVGDRTAGSSRPTTIATLRRGQSFGEIALVDQGLRSAAARSAVPETSLVIIPRPALMSFCERDHALGFRLMTNLAHDLATKIRNTDLKIREELLYAQRASVTGLAGG